MVFSSSAFLFFFLPLIIVLYYLMPNMKCKNFMLLIGSIFFYSWGEPIYVALLIFSSISDYLHGIWIENKIKRKRLNNARLILGSSIFINLLLLGFFKYSDFLISNLNSVFNCSIELLELPLPIGLSFFTFQTISYSIDVYKQRIKAQKNFMHFSMYVTMFPQLIAGPIVRYSDIHTEIENREHNISKIASGIELFIIGLAKKVLLANLCGVYYNDVWITNPDINLSIISGWFGMLFYTFQIYFDFSGYTDMAIGLSRVFGFSTYPKNFNYPYIAKSITEFWRRWHMTLGGFFRDYVYIPLGGNRVSKLMFIRNIFIVWALTGLWHGAAWNFVIWGLYFGIILLIEKFLIQKFILSKLHMIQHIYSFFLIVLGWVIFDAAGFSDVIFRFSVLFGFSEMDIFNNYSFFIIYNQSLLLLICIVASTPIYHFINSNYKLSLKKINFLRPIIFSSLYVISIAAMISSSFNPFIYFRF